MRAARRIVATLLLGCMMASSGSSLEFARADEPSSARADVQVARGLAAYRHLATWVDMYNPRVWKRPLRAVRKMKAKGVTTLFLETSSYRQPRAILRPGATGRFLDAAHRRGMSVVAWYVPSFAHLRTDFRRARAAIRFRTATGQRFDSFALDIEATVIRRISRRNRRLLRLSRRLRRSVGPSYTLGAIVPDPTGSTYWPRFPYRGVASRFDVFVPMSYFTYRTSGYRGVSRFISANIRAIRRRTGDRTIPIHVIGGIAGRTTRPEMRAFVRAVRRRRAMGGSLYDFPLTTRREWRVLARLRASS